MGAGKFRQAMAPVAEALNALVRAVEATGPRHGDMPGLESEGTKELANEEQYRARIGCSLGGMTLWAAADYVRSFASTLSGERPPIYGHLALARDALEASVVSFWLNEREIAYDERVKRGLSEVTCSAAEVKRLGLTEDADAKLSEVQAWCDELGWGLHMAGRLPVVDGRKRRSVPEGIRRLLVADEEARLRKLPWNRPSAVTHVTWWG